ncbi:MAG: cyaA 3 [Chthonomonadaceae bacterium]|nr:cyaA 3 [Chthonomonadaceae bacterium]
MPATIIIAGQQPILLTSSRYLIGRGDGCEVLLPEDDASASRRHALLERNDRAEWTVVDLGSRNGILVNGNRISDRVTLHDGDCLTVGKTSITLTLPRTQPTIQTAAPVFATPQEPAPASPVASLPQESAAVDAPAQPAPVGPSWAAVSLPPSTFDPASNVYTVPAAEASRQPDRVERASAFADSRPSAPASQDREASWHAPQHAAPLYTPVSPAPLMSPEKSRTPVVTGGIMLVVGLIAYFCWAQPGIDACQSGIGQIGMFVSALTGSQGLQQQCQMYAVGRIACALMSIGGGSLLGFALFRRR